MKRISSFGRVAILALSLGVLETPKDLCAASRWKSLLDQVTSTIEESEVQEQGAAVDVMVRHQTVWLRGEVSSEQAKQELVAAVERTPGVGHVVDNLKINPSLRLTKKDPFHGTRTVAEVLHAIEQINPEESFEVRASVRPGAIVLSGKVKSDKDKINIRTIAEGNNENLAVVDTICVARVSDKEIQDSVQKIVGAFPHDRVSGLTFGVANGIVTFGGKVPDHKDIDAVLADVLMVKGVCDITSSVHVP